MALFLTPSTDSLCLPTLTYRTNIPSSISALPLQFFWIDSKEFSGNIQGGLGDLIDLQSLLLQDKAFTETMPRKVCALVNGSSFGKMERLEVIGEASA